MGTRFKSGQELLEDGPRSRIPTSVNAETISKVKEAGACRPADNHQRGREWSGYLMRISTGNSDRKTTDGMGWEKMDPASRQCPKSHGYGSAAVLGRKQIALMLQPPYSLDLASCDFWLFPKLKTGLLGQCSVTLEDIKCKAPDSLATIPREAFHECFQAWQTVGSSVCVRRRDVLRGCLDWKALRFKYLSFTAEFRELFVRHCVYTVWGDAEISDASACSIL
jgi:hypothetical protein